MTRQTWAAAHTGCGASPDNTIASFLEGVRSGADIVEVDVHAALDGTALLMHDESPYLLTHTYAEMNRPEMRRTLGADYEQHEIARLEEVIQLAVQSGVKLNLDLKSTASIKPTVALVRKYGIQDKSFITGWCSEGIVEHFPDMQIMINTPGPPDGATDDQYAAYAEEMCRSAKAKGYAGLNTHYENCRAEMVEKAHALGLAVWVFTVNERELMNRYIRMGVDAITTRRPEELLVALQAERDRVG